ncbi:MAG: ankyrin repeat domain-containing protein, partial [Desulfobacterales bacterium]|nr:ankyrin repeat domain-containing protein [Desulfobacterales bacterium]
RDKDGQTSLLLAAWKGHVQVVSVLLAFKETDVNMPQKTGMTSLHLACRGGHLEVVKVWFKSGHPI